jgi:probable phosphoglycerate mutase
MEQLNPKILRNHYLAVRHGQSEANVKHEIVSSLKYGTHTAGLTGLGRDQAEIAAETLQQKLNGVTPVLYSSPLLRARQTAEIIAEKLHLHEPNFDPRLRERYFGVFDGGKATKNYENAWLADQLELMYDPSIDTPEKIAHRLTTLINDLEAKYQNETIILVSHGDPIQVLKSLFSDTPVYLHHVAPSVLPYVRNAEIVDLNPSKKVSSTAYQGSLWSLLF